MSRLWTCGFETGDSVDKYMDIYDLLRTTIESDKARTGSFSLRATLDWSVAVRLIPVSEEIFVGFATLADDPGASFNFFAILDPFAIPLLLVEWLDTGVFRIKCNGVSYDFSTPVSFGTWYFVEIRFVCDPSAGVIQARLSGNLEVDQTGIDTGGPSSIGGVQFFGEQGLSTEYIWFDDIAVNDASGAVDNSWTGDVHLEPLLPNASGDLSQWAMHPNTGESDFQDIDERPPDDDATHLYDSVDGQQFLVNLQDWDGTGKSPRKVHIWACARKESAEGGDQIKLIAKQGGVTEVGPAESLLTSYTLQSYTMDNAPDGGAWSDAKIDALQIGAEVEIVP